MNINDFDAERIKLQRLGLYVGIASIIISALTLYFNTKNLSYSKKS